MSEISPVQARDLRDQINQWRKGRATATLGDVLSDYYVGLFAFVMFSAMAGNVVRELSSQADQACLSTGCLSARSWMPWLMVVGTLVAVVGVARLLGPISAPPAVVTWMLASPVDRASLLRRRLAATLIVPAVAAVAIALPSGILAGESWLAVLTFTLAATGCAVAAVAVTARLQQHHQRAGLIALLGLAALGWVGLLAVADGALPALGSSAIVVISAVLLAIGLAVAVAVARQVRGRLGEFRSRELSPGGQLSANLSGAFAGLDFTLAYDVLLAHHSRQRGAVRVVRTRWRGVWAILHRDLVRLRRSPLRAFILLACVVAPYAAARADAGAITVLVAIMVMWPAVASLLVGLRVLSRERSMLRALPFADWVSGGVAIFVPALASLLVGLATTPALHASLNLRWSMSLVFGLAVGAGALAAGTRWMTGKPADYRAPMVATPAGALPTSALAAILRGFDIALITSAPMLIWTNGIGASISLVISAVVVWVSLDASR